MNNASLILNANQQLAVQKALEGQNLFVTGFAGTGKTAVIHKIQETCTKELVCLAPTGLAAVNLGKASTIHRFFAFKPGDFNKEEVDHQIWKRLMKTEVFLIDEISMVPCNIFWKMDKILQTIMGNELPFGGKQIIVCGDFYQLPPVVADEDYHKFLSENFDGLFSFETCSWYNSNFKKIILHEVIRQQDPEYIEILKAVRYGSNNTLRVLETLNQRVLPRPEGTITLCCRRIDAEKINQMEIARLLDPGKSFTGAVSGIFNAEDLPTAFELHIKKGEQVMLLSNHANLSEYDYVNGDLGTVIDYDDSSVAVLLHGKTVIVKPYTWFNYDYEYIEKTGELLCHEIGLFKQFPIAPAYATTIHKSQGLTMPRVHINLGKGCFVAGQLYTALSRAHDLNGITLEVPVTAGDLIVNPLITAFNQDNLPEEI